jgi:lysophospholipase L1-like esterase
MRLFTHINSIGVCTSLVALLLVPRPLLAQHDGWIATWTASPEPLQVDSSEPLLNIENQTVRERVRVSIGGAQLRLRLSNECGAGPLLVGAVTVGSPTVPAAVRPGSIRTVTFDGHGSITVPPGAPILSDPIHFPVTDGAEISISLFIPKRLAATTWHELALKRAIISPPGDYTHSEQIQDGRESPHSILISAVLVPTRRSQRLIVAFGDSIVDGDGSTLDGDDTWPSDLTRRLKENGTDSKVAVVNEGIGGNRLLSDGPMPSLGVSALARFDRDVLSLPGVTHVVLLEGLNDIGFPGAKLGNFSLADPADIRTDEDVIGAYRQLIARAHARGIKVIGATLNPCEGVDIPGYYSEAKEATRRAVNRWIRNSGAFDGVIDFDRILRDPDHPSRLAPRFASDDHLHPNHDGYQAMADAIDLSLFQ